MNCSQDSKIRGQESQANVQKHKFQRKKRLTQKDKITKYRKIRKITEKRSLSHLIFEKKDQLRKRQRGKK